MSAVLAEPVAVGVQTPRILAVPPGDLDYSLGDECIAWARECLRVELDDWQEFLLRLILARRPDGRWACRRFGLLISRQNGKSFVLLIRCLFGIVKLGERDVVFSAHLGDTVRSIFQLALALLEDAHGDVPGWKPYNSDGRERVEFSTGQMLRFKTRTKSGGRGLTGDVLVLDEAQELRDEQMEALTPILASKSMTGNPQVLFSGSAGNFESTVFARLRRSAMGGDAEGLGYCEWSIDDEAYFAADTFAREAIVKDPTARALANPTYLRVRPNGTGGISDEYFDDQLEDLSPAGFAREHLGVGTWPKDTSRDWAIPRVAWQQRAEPDRAVPEGRLAFALSASWGDRSVSIAAAGGTGDGGVYGWLERLDRGTAWVVAEVVRLVTASPTAAVLLDSGGPAAPLAEPLEQALRPYGVPLEKLSWREVGNACGGLSDSTIAGTFAHRGQLEVDAALAGARKKDIGEGLWAFDRKRSETDVAPLEALAIARHGWLQHGGGETEGWVFFE